MTKCVICKYKFAIDIPMYKFRNLSICVSCLKSKPHLVRRIIKKIKSNGAIIT